MGVRPTQSERVVALLFTRYPVATETFLQREVAALRLLGERPLLLALWPCGKLNGSAPDKPDDLLHPLELCTLFWWLPYWLVRNPRGMSRIADALISMRRPTPLNIAENLLGFGYGILRARRLCARCTHLHAVWASAPAAAAFALHALTGLPYSIAGHAYDLFEDGGDGLLEEKVRRAHFIRTSTEYAKRRWLRFGAGEAQVRVIRRGLPELPAFPPCRPPLPPYTILSVGRFVEKMGYPFLFEVLDLLRRRKVPFRAILVGTGPLLESMRRRARDAGLSGQLEMTGHLPYEKVEVLYAEADLFLFTGQVAQSGDRAGFPNAIGEAMAWGVPVCARPVGAVSEVIEDGVNGFIVHTPREAAATAQLLLENTEGHARIREAARRWVETAFDSVANMRRLRDLFLKAHPRNPDAVP